MSKSKHTSKLTLKVSETKGFGEGDIRLAVFFLSETFLGNELDGNFIFSGFFSSSKRSKFRRFCFSRGRTCPFSTLDAIERRVLCKKFKLASFGSFNDPGNGPFLSSALEVLICRGLKNDTLLLPVSSTSGIVGGLEFKVCVLVKTSVEAAGKKYQYMATAGERIYHGVLTFYIFQDYGVLAGRFLVLIWEDRERCLMFGR